MDFLYGIWKYIDSYLAFPLGGNTLREYVLAFLLFVLLFIVFRIFKRVFVKKLSKFASKTDNEIDDELVNVIDNISPLFYFVLALYFPLRMLAKVPLVDRVIEGVFLVILIYQFIKAFRHVIVFGARKAAVKNGREAQVETMVNAVTLITNIVLWSVGILLILSNVGVNITSLVASLGIGGIAVALAAQNILGDIFSSFSIYFDKPFQIGDFIIVGKDMGTVKQIGLKTTRIMTLQGEELVIANKELTDSRVQNFKRMKKRRVLFQIGVVYGTSVAKLKKANEIIKKSVESVEGTEFDRVHFFEFGDFSLKMEVVFYVLSPDYNEYMDIREKVNWEIKAGFEKEGIEMAFPTQTLYVEKV